MAIRPESGYRQLRAGRVSEPGRIYLVSWNTAGRRKLFNAVEPARIVVRALQHCDRVEWTGTFAYVVMPDHVHWLFELGRQKALETVVQSVRSYSSRRIRQALEIPGRIWQLGFHDRALRKEDDLLSASRYIVANPLRAGLVGNIGDYPHWDAVWLTAE